MMLRLVLMSLLLLLALVLLGLVLLGLLLGLVLLGLLLGLVLLRLLLGCKLVLSSLLAAKACGQPLRPCRLRPGNAELLSPPPVRPD